MNSDRADRDSCSNLRASQFRQLADFQIGAEHGAGAWSDGGDTGWQVFSQARVRVGGLDYWSGLREDAFGQ